MSAPSADRRTLVSPNALDPTIADSARAPMSYPCYSFVVPVYNEAETLPEFARQLADVMSRLDGDAEVLLVDDGSTDESPAIIRRICDDDVRIRALWLSRNFGHQIAITAGLDHARGDAIVVMDADLQDPPDVVLEMAQQWRAGYRVVYAVRDDRVGDSPVKRVTAKWFYRALNRLTDVQIPLDTGDFRLVDRVALDAVLRMPEHRRFLRGMFAWVGFDQTGVRYVRPARFAGSTKFSFRKMLSFAAVKKRVRLFTRIVRQKKIGQQNTLRQFCR